MSTRRERSQLQIHGDAQPQPDMSSEQEKAQQIAPANISRHPLSLASAAASSGFQVCGLPSIERETTVTRYRSSDYKQGNGSFFESGRVFATLWSEQLGSTITRTDSHGPELSGKNPNITLAPYGTNVYSYVRRFIVVKNRHGYCRCVPITTYNGKGLLKPGLTPRDIDAHAIVYDSNRDQVRPKDEPATSKSPIAVDMAGMQSLAPSSLVHLAKPYCMQ